MVTKAKNDLMNTILGIIYNNVCHKMLRNSCVVKLLISFICAIFVQYRYITFIIIVHFELEVWVVVDEHELLYSLFVNILEEKGQILKS